MKKIYNEKVRNFFNDITISTSWVPQSSSSKVYVLRGACSINVCDSVFLNKVRFIFIFHYFSLIFKQVFLRETLYSCFFQQFSSSPWLIRYEKLQNYVGLDKSCYRNENESQSNILEKEIKAYFFKSVFFISAVTVITNVLN